MQSNNTYSFPNRAARVALSVLALLIASSSTIQAKDIITKPLFMQNKRANIEFPARPGNGNGNGTQQSGVLTEKVDYKHADNRTTSDKTVADTTQYGIDKVNHLREVQVVSQYKSSFAPERDGRVSVDFVIRVPKELLSYNWRLTISPKLLHNDSIVKLEDVVLKGLDFHEKQVADHKAYEEYVGSIIDKDDYDNQFIDKQGISKDIHDRQTFYLGMYNEEWGRLMSYKEWDQMMNMRHAESNVKVKAANMKAYNKKMRKSQEEMIRAAAYGKDTTGVYNKLSKKHAKKTSTGRRAIERTLDEKSIPSKYESFYKDNTQPGDLTNIVVTDKDSVNIAKHRYFFGAIAENESKIARKDIMRDYMIPYPYETNTRIDSVVMADRDMLIYYKQDYPVSPGLKRLRMTISGQINAIDMSGYTLEKADTLNFMISSLSQLVDTTLVVKKTKLFKNMFDKLTIYPKFESNKSDFNLSYQDNAAQMDKVRAKLINFTETMGLAIDSIELTSTGSLDGAYDNNVILAGNRGESLQSYLASSMPHTDMSSYRLESIGEDWTMLVRLLRARTDLRNKEAVLSVLGAAVYPDDTEAEIKSNFVDDYKIIHDSIYPKLRRLDIVFNLSRPEMDTTDTTLMEVREDYAVGLKLLQDGKYWEALDALAAYPDYNMALCLTIMGYNGKAYDLLVQLTPTANTEYLLAIICKRMEKDEEAITRLLNACQLSTMKAYRSKLDPEIIDLVNTYNLQPQLDEIIAGISGENKDGVPSSGGSSFETEGAIIVIEDSYPDSGSNSNETVIGDGESPIIIEESAPQGGGEAPATQSNNSSGEEEIPLIF